MAARRILALISLSLVGALTACGSSGHPTATMSAAPAQSATGSVKPPGWGGTPPGFVLPPQSFSAVPTAEMFDAITLGNVPRAPFAVAGYTSGFWPTWFQLASDFPAAHRVSIAISAAHHAMCLDVEPGDALPSQAGAWAVSDIRAGFPHPCIYADLSEMPAVRASLQAAQGANWHATDLLWLAWYRFVPGLVAGYDAVQWTDRALGRNLDESTVTLNFLRIASPPYTPPKPKPKPKPAKWSSAQVQLLNSLNGTATVRVNKGHWTVSGKGWRVRSQPYNSKPLGG